MEEILGTSNAQTSLQAYTNQANISSKETNETVVTDPRAVEICELPNKIQNTWLKKAQEDGIQPRQLN